MLYCLLLIVSRAYEGVTSYKLGQSERFKRGVFGMSPRGERGDPGAVRIGRMPTWGAIND